MTSWNLQGSKRTDLDRIAAELRRLGPDVILAQEIRRPQATGLAERLGLQHHWAFKHHPFRPLAPATAEGAAILTPHRLDDVGSEAISDETSLRSWRRRIVVWATVRRPDGSAHRVFNSHLSPHGLRAERVVEADRISAIAKRLGPIPPIIVGGDLNDHDDRELLDHLPGVEHVPSPATNPAEAPRQILDHILLPTDADDVTIDVPEGGDRWREMSDHLPVTVGFTPSPG